MSYQFTGGRFQIVGALPGVKPTAAGDSEVIAAQKALRDARAAFPLTPAGTAGGTFDSSTYDDAIKIAFSNKTAAAKITSDALVRSNNVADIAQARQWVLDDKKAIADQKILDKAQSAKGAGAAAARKAAEKVKADAKGRAGAKAGADFKEAAARSGAATAQTKIDELFATLKGTANELNATEETRIKGLYDGLDSSAQARFDEQIGQLGLDTAAGQDTIATANKSFADNFQGSKSFEGVPVQQFETGANPLIGALQAQGAGTSEVDAAIASENQGMKGTADLQKWMISQLNTGSQNFDNSVKNAASQAGAASLAELLQRSTTIKGGMTRDASLATDQLNLARGGEQSAAAKAFADQLSKITSGKTDATTGVTTTLQAALAEADSTRAASLTAYGPAPKAKLNFAQRVAAKHPNFKGTTAEARKKFPKLLAGK